MNRAKTACVAILLGCGWMLQACQVPAPGDSPSQGTILSPAVTSSTDSSVSVSTNGSPSVSVPTESSVGATASQGRSTEIEVSSANSSTVLMNDDGTGLVSFGMTPADVCSAINGLGLSCVPSSGVDNDDEVYMGDSWFSFDFGKLRSFSIVDNKFRSERGLEVGDPVSRLFQLYGTDYQKDGGSGALCYEYQLSGGITFTACTGSEEHEAQGTPDELIDGWGLSGPYVGPTG